MFPKNMGDDMMNVMRTSMVLLTPGMSIARNNGSLRGQIARNYRPLRHEHWATRVPE